MKFKRVGLVALLGSLGIGLGACTDGYGYSGVNVGVGSGFYNDGYYGGGAGYYGDPYYAGGFGGAYAPSYYGWYNNYYYPGTGAFVYDRYRRPYRWNDSQRRYWEGRRGNAQVRQNWGDFRRDVRGERRDYRGDIRDNRQAYRNGQITREQFRQGRRDARREYRGDVRQDYRDLRRQNRAEGVRTPRPQGAFRPGGRGDGFRGRGGGFRGGRGPNPR